MSKNPFILSQGGFIGIVQYRGRTHLNLKFFFFFFLERSEFSTDSFDSGEGTERSLGQRGSFSLIYRVCILDSGEEQHLPDAG